MIERDKVGLDVKLELKSQAEKPLAAFIYAMRPQPVREEHILFLTG